MKNTLTTTQKTEVILAKGKSLLGITAKILSGTKALTTATPPHKDVTIMGDLMWQKKTQYKMEWDAAMEYAKNLRLGGYDDWRLPTLEELELVVKRCGGINVELADDDWEAITNKNIANVLYQENYEAKGFAPDVYWSSTTYNGTSGNALYVSFYNGSQYDGDQHYYNMSISPYVRCVRERQ